MELQHKFLITRVARNLHRQGSLVEIALVKEAIQGDFTNKNPPMVMFHGKTVDNFHLIDGIMMR